MHERRGFGPLAHPQRTDALGTVDLVGGESDEVWALRDRHAPEPLDRVTQHQRARGVGNTGDVGDRLDHTNLVIDQHCRHQTG